MHSEMNYFVFSGKGCVFSFDPVGSYERETYRAGGSASSMLQPLLDNQVSHQVLFQLARLMDCLGLSVHI